MQQVIRKQVEGDGAVLSVKLSVSQDNTRSVFILICSVHNYSYNTFMTCVKKALGNWCLILGNWCLILDSVLFFCA